MRLLLLSTPPEQLASSLRELQDAERLTLIEAPGRERRRPPDWDAALADADETVAFLRDGDSGAPSSPLVVWGAAPSAVDALAAGADLWLDPHEPAPHIAARLAAAIRSAGRREPPPLDPATGIPSPATFHELLRHEFERATRYRRQVALLALAPDGLDGATRALGRPAGEVVLRELVGLVRPLIRDVDVLARLSGDRLGLLLPETDAAGGVAAGRRLAAAVAASPVAVRRPNARSSTPLRLTVSVGLAAVPSRGIERPADLHGRALESLLQAQRAGGERVIAFGDSSVVWSREAPDPARL